MMKSAYFPVCVGLMTALWLVGCANLTSPARMHELADNKSYWLDYDASRRGTIVLPKGSPETQVATCAEPSPDVALEFANKILAEAKVKAVDAKVQAEFNTNVIELAKRTQTIMFLREAMFRLCEQSLNNKFSAEDVKTLYQLVIDTSLKMHEAELAQRSVELAKELKDPETRKIMEEFFKGTTPK